METSYKDLEIVHDKEHKRFTLAIAGTVAKVDYTLKNDKLYLIHSEVPASLRGKGIGKVLVEKTFQHILENDYSAVAVCTYIKSVKNKSEYWKKIIQ